MMERTVPEPFREAPQIRRRLDGKQLQKVRELRGWSQAQLAQMLGVPVSEVQEWENTKFYVEGNLRRKLVEFLGEDYYRPFNQADSVEVGNQGMQSPPPATPPTPAKTQGAQQCLEIFFCYARKDQQLLNELKAHLMSLQRQGLISIWADSDISAGTDWEQEIEKHLDTAHIILLLVSSDFMNSEYCYSKEMKRAVGRHERGEARVIPIILRPVYWQGAPFGKLQALPTDAKPVVDRSWHTLDEALLSVVEGIRKTVEEMTTS